MSLHTGASVSMLQLIQEVKAKVGKEEDGEDYEALERIMRSNNFNNLMKVSVVIPADHVCDVRMCYHQLCTVMRQLISHDPQPVDKHVTLSALLVCSTVLII